MRGPAGRFAPSPTGPLHLGSLYTALASFLDARSRGENWYVRIDDLDTPRNVDGADDEILFALEAHGLVWDGSIDRQSEHLERYTSVMTELNRLGLLYYCRCSRRTLAGLSRYPGTCRACIEPLKDSATRIVTDGTTITFEDACCGTQSVLLDRDVGDFIVQRRDGIFGYQLATAVDDGEDAITSVIRGRDLLDNTSPQLWLMKILGLGAPDYAHLPVVCDHHGTKLSKQTHAPPVQSGQALHNLRTCLMLFGFSRPPPAMAVEELLQWAVSGWDRASLPDGDVAVQSDPAGPA
ncbi:MAG: tRNA glutamyl-Q(34) synthetase GluQRS [Pseudomonadales bacterium]|jgi:glutamyl-Q tRNA(Asp) synthetase|nr:tRNA glutamyl-Q(34) synthetase GluQRS [Pseudomonadales bacterium]MDP6970032.1 tRNA glutamyl-Q(34) synthetase GluQRS [Pseudomonadales bacterium]|tara:strand:- start:559 stop:1440 length:882 start_codon:yes stop_codon:yes gene_type:complete